MRLSSYLQLFLLAALSPALGYGQDGLDTLQLVSTKVTDTIMMLAGAGGNMALCSGPDGAFLIDDEYAPLADKIRAAAGVPIRFVLNTHLHGDHVSGNAAMAAAGATIVAHENVRARMAAPQTTASLHRQAPASPVEALPRLTFPDRMTFHMNGEEIQIVHVLPSHTDGDAVVTFRKANVMHLGDLYFAGQFPFIDPDAGGSLNGVLTVLDKILMQTNAQTRFIPGHGPLSTFTDLKEYRNMLVTVRSRIVRLIGQKKTIDQVLAAKVTSEFDATYGHGFMNAERFVRLAFESLKKP